jgi:hypothetical protein
MKNTIMMLLLVFALVATGCQETRIGGIQCDAETLCPDGMACWQVEGSLPQCFEENPCDFYCDGKCTISESYPPQVSCS